MIKLMEVILATPSDQLDIEGHLVDGSLHRLSTLSLLSGHSKDVHQSFLSEQLKVSTDKEDLINSYHCSFTGHLGINKTVDKLKEHGHDWLHMYMHVRAIIARCPTCQKNSIHPHLLQGAHFTCNANRPMEMIAVDTITGLKVTAEGFNSIIVVVDTFTRYVKLYPTCDLTSETAAKVLFDFMCEFGVPHSILTDNGTQHANQTLTELLNKLGVERRLSLAYSHQENAIVERVNREVVRHVKNIVVDQRIKDDWPRAIPFAQRIINATVHPATGFAPYKLVFGDRVDLDRHLFSADFVSADLPITEWVDRMVKLHSDMLDVALTNQLTLNAKKSYEESALLVPGDLVLWKPEPSVYGGKRKLEPNLFGPYKVISQVGTQVHIEEIHTHREKVVHISNLIHYDGSHPTITPECIAQVDEGLYNVEKCLQHRKKPGRGGLTFFIKWKDFSDDENSWEPLSNVRDNSIVHAYMLTHGMQDKIPLCYRR